MYSPFFMFVFTPTHWVLPLGVSIQRWNSSVLLTIFFLCFEFSFDFDTLIKEYL